MKGHTGNMLTRFKQFCAGSLLTVLCCLQAACGDAKALKGSNLRPYSLARPAYQLVEVQFEEPGDPSRCRSGVHFRLDLQQRDAWLKDCRGLAHQQQVLAFQVSPMEREELEGSLRSLPLKKYLNPEIVCLESGSPAMRQLRVVDKRGLAEIFISEDAVREEEGPCPKWVKAHGTFVEADLKQLHKQIEEHLEED